MIYCECDSLIGGSFGLLAGEALGNRSGARDKPHVSLLHVEAPKSWSCLGNVGPQVSFSFVRAVKHVGASALHLWPAPGNPDLRFQRPEKGTARAAAGRPSDRLDRRSLFGSRKPHASNSVCSTRASCALVLR